MAKYPIYKQLDKMDCGASCLRMVCKFYGKTFTLEFLRKKCYADRTGVSLWSLSNAATEIGFRTLYAKVPFDDLRDAVAPNIVHWKGNHFVVVYKVSRNKVLVGDPAIGLITYTEEEFIRGWTNNDTDSQGIVLLLEPTPHFQMVDDESGKDYIGFRFFSLYLRPFKRYYLQLILGMIATAGFSLIMPFLTQSIIDVGITNKNIAFINLVLIAQVMFSVSSTLLNFVRNWIFLHIGTRINIAIISDYLIKLLRLPVSFFDSRMIGDILQRIGDHSKIQSFISSATLGVLFSVVNFIIFTCVMAYYSITILLIFLAFSALYAGWIMLFLKKRKEFNYKFFERSSVRQSALIQLVHGVQDIKLHNYEDQKRWEWERIQAQTFRINIKQLTLTQYQQGGAFFIETIKSILISYLSAKLVINGEITLGMMLSMQYILGQISGPVMQITGLINSYQDAKISLERIGEIHAHEDEAAQETYPYHEVPEGQDIRFENVSFSYNGSPNEYVLKNVSFTIPYKKTTAIVGASGGGKTTILRLLLKFYTATKGTIYVGNHRLNDINNRAWRDKCGAVLQDGYIFSDSLAENIALSDSDISLEKLENAAHIANIQEFVRSLPNGYHSKIGKDGSGLSQGQKQRVLIARAIYRNPSFLLLDEATNSLDAKNESDIIEKMSAAFEHKTVVIVAHRLSTIINADQIIVLHQGEIAETGTHEELMRKEGVYHELIRKQTSHIH